MNTKTLTSTEQNKILLYGDMELRNYRSQILIKYLQDSGYAVLRLEPRSKQSKYKQQMKYLPKIKFMLATAFCWIELLIKAAIADIIYIPPLNTFFIKSAIWVSKFFNKKLIVEIHTLLYDTHVRDRKKIKDGSREARKIIEKDILSLTKSDCIIYASERELNYWEKLLNIKADAQKIFKAPLFSASLLVSTRSFMQDGRLQICWWGTFIPLHGLAEILAALKILQKQDLPFTCNLFGIDNDFFVKYIEKIQLEQLGANVFLRKDLSFADDSLPNYLVDNCDLALGIFGNTDKAYHAIPNKLIEALSMRIPTLTMNSPALTEFFNPETDLWVCEPSPESIAEAILKITNGAAYPVDWEQTRQKVLNTFSMTQYQEVVSQVLAKVKNDCIPENYTRETLLS
jgi:glycosyltransferase involved in cell wall biosynthesis